MSQIFVPPIVDIPAGDRRAALERNAFPRQPRRVTFTYV
jgi:hypothetical protein